MKGLFIPEITAEMFRNGCLESIEALMAEGEIKDIEYSPWIPISERTPEKDVEVLATTRWGEITIAERYSANDWFIHEGSTNANADEIVAWMPLPAPFKPQPNERTEERTEMHECDCISRKAVLDALHSKFADGFDGPDGDKWWNSAVVLGAINEVPSVIPQSKEEPQQKTGHWEWVQYESKPNFGNWHCSECRHILCGAIKGNPVKLPNYCEECGSYNGGAK